MASTINASTSAGLVSTADTSGVLQLQTAGTTAVSIDASQAVTFSAGTANGVSYLNGSKVLTTGSALTFDGNGTLTIARPSGVGNTQITLTNNAGGASGFQFGQSAQSQQFFIYDTGAAKDRYLITSTGEHVWYGASEQMRLTSTGLGIGTSSPRAKLDVSGSALIGTYQTSTNYGVVSIKTADTSTAGAFASSAITIWNPTTVGTYSQISFGYNTLGLTNAAAYFGYISTSTAGGGKGDLVFGTRDVTTDTAATERLRLDSAGNLGLGVTPSALGSAYRGFEFGNAGSWLFGGTSTATQTYLTANAYFNGTNWIYKNTNPASYFAQSAGQHQWYNAPSGTAGNAITFTQAMTLDASGNLGIGTSSPQSRLEARQDQAGAITRIIVNNNNATSGSGSAFDYYFGTTRLGGITHGFSTQAYLAFDVWNGSAATERMRLDSSGNLGIGTTANASAILDAQSTTKGVRMPNMTTTQKNAISSPAAGLMVFDTTLAKLCVYSGSAWQTITSV